MIMVWTYCRSKVIAFKTTYHDKWKLVSSAKSSFFCILLTDNKNQESKRYAQQEVLKEDCLMMSSIHSYKLYNM